MVAKSPAKQRRMLFPPLNPTLLRETVTKVDKCMARLQELQYTVAGGSKMVCGIRFKNTNPRKSPSGKLLIQTEEWRRMSLPAMLVGETVGEILQASKFAREIVAATHPSNYLKPLSDDPKTPLSVRRKPRLINNTENSELRSRRRREKQVNVRKEFDSPVLQRARSRISFKASSPLHFQEKENNRYLANRVSPRNKPWTKKTVLFPNPLFYSSPTSNNPSFCKTKSPIIAKSRPKTPHKFLIKTRSPAPKSPPFKITSSSNAVRLKRSFSPPIKVSSTSTAARLRSYSPLFKVSSSGTVDRLKRPLSPPLKVSSSSTATRLKRSFSPSRLTNKLINTRSPAPESPPFKVSSSSNAARLKRSFSPPIKTSTSNAAVRLRSCSPPLKVSSGTAARLKRSVSPPLKISSSSTAARLKRSFSPSRLANKLMSPLKTRKSFVQKGDGLVSGMKQRPGFTPIRFPARRI